MTLAQAKNFISIRYPDALWVVTGWFKGEPDIYAVLDFTFSDEVRVKLFEYDICTSSLIDCQSSQEITQLRSSEHE